MITQHYYQPFPVIDLGEVVLRALTDDDAEAYFKYMSRPEMIAFLTEANYPKTLDHALEEVRYWGSLFANKRSFYWAIALKESNKLIGTAGFNMILPAHMRAEISYDLDYNYWGQGVMLKSIKNILRFADLVLGIVRVQATVIMDNERSIKVLERCGFSQEGILKKYEIVEGVHKDYYMYARIN